MSSRYNRRGGHDYGVRHLSADQNASLESIVEGVLDQERPDQGTTLTAETLILLGAVYAEGERVLNRQALIRAGTLVRIHTQPRRYPPLADIQSRIVNETQGYLIVDKPAGLPVHAMVDNEKENLLSYLQAHLGRPVYITHRLDIETSGLILIALTPGAQRAFNKQLAAKEIKRRYVAFTQKAVRPATYVHYMEDSPRAPKVMHDAEANGRLRCELTVMSCAEVPRGELAGHWQIETLIEAPLYLLEIELGTGRTQQIRAQLFHLGASIVGDRLYKNDNCLYDRLTLRRAIGLRAETLTLP